MAAARAAYIAGFEATSNLEAGRRYGVPTRGTSAHSFTLLHASESRGVRGPDRRARRGHHAAGRHLRRDGRGPHRGGADRMAAWARSGSTPVTWACWPARSGELLDSARRRPDQDHRHQRPGRVRDRRPVRGAGRRLRRRHRPGHRQRPPDVGLRLQAGGPGRRRRPRTRRWSRWPRRASTRSASAGRKYALRRLSDDGVAEAELIGIGRAADERPQRPGPAGALGRAAARSSARRPLIAARERHVRVARRSCRWRR